MSRAFELTARAWQLPTPATEQVRGFDTRAYRVLQGDEIAMADRVAFLSKCLRAAEEGNTQEQLWGAAHAVAWKAEREDLIARLNRGGAA